MRVVEVSGRTVEEAVARALGQLGLNQGQVDVDVIREGKRGLLGFGAEEAIVRVAAKEGVSTLPQSGRGRGPRPRPDGAPRRSGQDGPGGEQEAEGRRRERAGTPDEAGGERDGDGRGRRRGGRGRGGGGGDGGGGGGGGRAPAGERRGEREPREYTAVDEPTRVPGVPADAPTAPSDDAEDATDFAGRSLRDILTLLGLTDTAIEGREPETAGDGSGLVGQIFDVYGENEETSDELGALIGRRGETLGALQYLLNVMVSSRFEDERLFGLDVEDYRRRREQSLVDMAQRVADEVRLTGDVITLEPMPAAERRIVHITIKEEEGVVTESVGDGDRRQVEVMPASAAENGE